MKRYAVTITILTLIFSGFLFAALPSHVRAVDILKNEPTCVNNTTTQAQTSCDSQAICNKTTATGSAPEICADNSSSNTDSQNPIYGKDGVVTKGIRIFLVIFGIAAIFVLLINAVRMITSNGDSNSTNNARDGIIYAAIGIAVAVFAQVIITFIVNKVGS